VTRNISLTGDRPPGWGRVLIIDDEPANLLLLERLLQRAGYTELRSIADSREAMAALREYEPDVILLDLLMPYLDGFEILRLLADENAGKPYLPCLVLTADITAEARTRALSLGATDFLTKPFNGVELLLRLGNALRARYLSLAQENQNQLLEYRVRQRTEQLELARLEVIERLAYVSEFRDDETHRHTQRVGDLSASLARVLGLPERRVETIRRIAPLHDIGKIGIADAILLKRGKLSPAEFEQMKLHTVIGARILAGGRSRLIRMAEQLALTHHERWDGRGYPNGLAGADIPVISRIVSVADVFDALTHARPYKPAWLVELALTEIRAQAGSQLDPRVVEALCLVVEHGAQNPNSPAGEPLPASALGP
jgi:putative two-component system response regulator